LVNSLKTLTIFTPTYNRGYCLNKCYESLKRQTSKDFIWLIIDDGSTDNTKELIDLWKSENEIEIKYHYQPNGGMHVGHNSGFSLSNTELTMYVDSDDYLTNNAVGKIVKFWRENYDGNSIGILALNMRETGKIIGNKFPDDLKLAYYRDLYPTKLITGDKRRIYRTDIARNYPYPVIEGEKYLSASYKQVQLDEFGPMLLMNDVIGIMCISEDSNSSNKIKQYIKNPKGYQELRLAHMRMIEDKKYRFRHSIHYVSSSIIAKDKKWLYRSPCKLITSLAVVPGIMLWIYLLLMRNKKKKIRK
jgi:glycosyltransferase involved in cell wall biosynthesis